MNLEQLNVAELSSEELVETTGGRIKPITDLDVILEFGAQIFGVTPEAQRKLWNAAFN